MRWLLVLLGASTLASGQERPAQGPSLPRPGDLNAIVLDVLRKYPADGTHRYYWPKEGSWRD